MSRISPDPDVPLSPVKPQSLPKSTVSAPSSSAAHSEFTGMTLSFSGIQRTRSILTDHVTNSPGETLALLFIFALQPQKQV